MQDQDDTKINSHVEAYLDYYCKLSHAPGFAVLLKGQWGSGKTWFIERYQEKLKENNQKRLYISLYGISTTSEIEDKFFQLLHPIMSSKGMAFTGIIFKGLLKGSLKIDLNSDNKDDGTWNIQIPKIDLPKELKDIDKSILIFDDLERCNIEISTLLGYINYFVEHQDIKVILVANEEKLYENTSYKSIKEKLIGQTFDIAPDFDGGLENFITHTDDTSVRNFLSDNLMLIKDLYNIAKYDNLRSLKQIILDFQRIFENLPDQAKAKPDLLKDLLQWLMAFSIEIKRGSMLPEDISKLQEEYQSLVKKTVAYRREGIVKEDEDKDEKNTSLQTILERYSFLNLHEPFPSATWWQIFFDQGTIDKHELDKSLFSSKYFPDENTPDWIKLFYFYKLSDDDFDVLLKKIETEYNNRIFTKLGEIKHIFGLFLMFSDAGIYPKPKKEILEDAQKYIDELKSKAQLEALPYSITGETEIANISGSYLNLIFYGKEFKEFKDFCSYIDKAQRSDRSDKMPEAAQTLLDAMQTDQWKFHRMIAPNSSDSEDISEPRYDKTPILNYIDEDDFMKKFLALAHKDQRQILWSISQRYKYEPINDKFIEELGWLESIESLLRKEADRRKGKLSGLLLQQLEETNYLREAITKLERQKENLQNQQ